MEPSTSSSEQHAEAPAGGALAWVRGAFSKLTFGYVVKHIWTARRHGVLDFASMSMPQENTAREAYARFAVQWQRELVLKMTRHGAGTPSLLRALRRAFGAYYLVAGLCKLMWSAFVILGAFYFVHSLLSHVQSNKSIYASDLAGWCLTVGFFIDALLLGLSLQRMGYIAMQAGLRVRACLVQAVAEKAFRLAAVRHDHAANIVNFVSSDIQKIFDGALEFHYLWTAPIEAAAILGLLAYVTGKAMLPGLGVILLIIPLQYMFGYNIVRIKLAQGQHAKARSGILQEVLPAIKLVKYYAWERHFENEVEKVRKEELKLGFWNAVMKVINVAVVFCVPPMTAFVIFTVYEFTTARLASSVAFTTL